MKRIIVFAVVLGMVATCSPAWCAKYFESVTVANSAVSLSVSQISGPVSSVSCTLETAQIRYRMDGDSPTASEGHLMNVGGQITLTDYESIARFKAIRTGGTSGVLKCTYF